MLDDVRHAIRGLTRTPGMTAAALLMIALGTGANAAMFSVIDAVLVRSPFPESSRLVLVRGVPASEPLTVAQGRSLLETRGVFASAGAIGGGGRMTLRGVGEPRRVNVECVTADLFTVLGTPPIAGRTFSPTISGPRRAPHGCAAAGRGRCWSRRRSRCRSCCSSARRC